MLENISSKNGKALLGIAFSFLLSNASLGAAKVRHGWSPREDQRLIEAVETLGAVNWTAVAALVPNRTPEQCRNRWMKALDSAINKGAWTEADEQLLIDLYLALGRRWKKIAEHFQGRTDKHCRSSLASFIARWKEIPYQQASNLVNHPTPEFLEDLRKEAEARHGDLDAVDGAAAPAQGPAADGDGAAATGELLAPRDDQAEVPAGARPGVAKVRHCWSPAEDYLLRGAVAIHGTGDWDVVAASVPNRTPKQCQDRWMKALDSAINKGPWTEEEDQILVDFRQKNESWTGIAGRLPGRIDHQCRYRFASLIARQHDQAEVPAGGTPDAVVDVADLANPPPPPASSHVPALGLAADGHGVAATGELLVPRGVPAGVPGGGNRVAVANVADLAPLPPPRPAPRPALPFPMVVQAGAAAGGNPVAVVDVVDPASPRPLRRRRRKAAANETLDVVANVLDIAPLLLYPPASRLAPPLVPRQGPAADRDGTPAVADGAVGHANPRPALPFYF